MVTNKGRGTVYARENLDWAMMAHDLNYIYGDHADEMALALKRIHKRDIAKFRELVKESAKSTPFEKIEDALTELGLLKK